MAAIVVDTAQAPTQRRRKTYTPPALIRGPVLAKIAAGQVSGGGGDNCWIARAAFGEGDFRWMIFRAWLFEDAPDWFRAGYLRYGRGVGAWLARRDTARAAVRAAMLVAVRRKLTVR